MFAPGAGEGLPVGPWQPLARGRRQFCRVALQLGEILERVRAAQLARVNQRHEQVADARSVLGPIEERVLPVKDGLFKGAFDDIVVERRPWLSEKQGQRVPVL